MSAKLTNAHKRVLEALAAHEHERGNVTADAQGVLETLITAGIAHAILEDPKSADAIGRAGGLSAREIETLKMGAYQARANALSGK